MIVYERPYDEDLRRLNSSMALRLHNRRWYPLIVLFGSAIVIAGWRYCSVFHKSELLIPAIGGVAAFTYFIYRQHLDEAKFFRELFTEFNRRYDALNENLTAIY